WVYGPEFAACNLLTRTEGVHLPPADDIDPVPVGHHGGERAVGVRPNLLPGQGVEPVRAPLERGEVDDAVDDGRRAGDRAVRGELPEDRSRRRVEGVERVVVRADEDAAVPDRRGAVHEAAGLVRPAQLSALLAVRVDVTVGRAEIDARVGD